MNNIDFNLIGMAKAQEINRALTGRPTENRIVLAVTTTDRKAGGLFIPDNDDKEIPKKGVIVSKGVTHDDAVHLSLRIGEVVLYGMYGGKEIYPEFKSPVEGAEALKFYVLSSSEVIYVEPNNKD